MTLSGSSKAVVSGEAVVGGPTTLTTNYNQYGTPAEISTGGPGASFTADTIAVSQSSTGTGLLAATGGGKIIATRDLTLGAAAEGSGTASVSGAGSEIKGNRILLGRHAGSNGYATVSNGGSLTATDSVILGPVTGSSNARLTIGGDNGASGFHEAGGVNALAILGSNSPAGSTVDFRHQTPAYAFAPRLQNIAVINQSGSGKTTLTGRLWDVGTVLASNGTLELAFAAGVNNMEYLGARDGGKVVLNGADVITPESIIPRVILGASGSGSLSIINGGTLKTTALQLGGSAFGSGTVEVDGQGSALTLQGASSLDIGATGNGQVILRRAGRLVTADPNNPTPVTLGVNSGRSGSLTLSGSTYPTNLLIPQNQFTFLNAGQLTIGQSGSGTVTAEGNSSRISAESAVLASQPGSQGVVHLNGGVMQVAASPMAVGRAGTGRMELQNSGLLRVGADGAGTLVLGELASARGSLKIGDGGLPGWLQAGRVMAGAATATPEVTFRHTTSAYTFSPQLTGVNVRIPDGNTGNTTLTAPGSSVFDVWVTTGGLRVRQGGQLTAGSVILGDERSQDLNSPPSPLLEVDGPGSLVRVTDAPLHVGMEADATLRVSNGGEVNIGYPDDEEVSLGGDGVAGTVIFGGGGAAPGQLRATRLYGYGGTSLNDSAVVFDHGAPDFIMATPLAGALDVRHTAGTTLLTGASDYTGDTSVTGGTLLFASSQASVVTVTSGGTFGGIGTTPRINLHSGATLSPGTFRDVDAIGSQRFTQLNLFGGSTIRIDLGPGLTCDKVLNHRTGLVVTTLYPVTSGKITFDFRNKGIDQTGVYPVLYTTHTLTEDFMSRLQYVSDFPLQGSFRQIGYRGVLYNHTRLEFVVTATGSMISYNTWAQGQGLNPVGNGLPAADPDGDGVGNMIEYLLRSSPVSSVPQNLPVFSVNDTHLNFNFMTHPGVSDLFQVSIEYSSDLKN